MSVKGSGEINKAMAAAIVRHFGNWRLILLSISVGFTQGNASFSAAEYVETNNVLSIIITKYRDRYKLVVMVKY